MIPLAQDRTLKQRLKHPPHREQIIKRAERPRRRLDRAPQISPRGRDHQMTAVRQHHDQLQPTMTVHPTHQLKRAALPRVTRPKNPHRRRETIEVGLMSCLPSIAFSTTP
jgi:hypothetical protein